MKNTLAENLLRFGVKNLSEAQIKFLQEQADQPALSGGSSTYLQQVPNFDKFIKFDANLKNTGNPTGMWSFSPILFEQYMIEYLGGQQSGGEGIIGKNIFFFKNTIASLSKTETSIRATAGGVTKEVPNTATKYIGFDKNNTDSIITGTFVPGAWYYGRYYQNPKRIILYLFNREITTNYSGDPNAPFITTNGTKVMQAADVTYTFGDLNVPMAGESQIPYVDDIKLIPETLVPSNKLKRGVDYITLETTSTGDFYSPEFKGYADYLSYLGFGNKGKNTIGISSIGVTQTKQVTAK